MSYINVYPARIDWENEPSINTPINALNLNRMDYALYSIDQTLANWDTSKANQSDLLLSVKSIDYDTSTGVFVFTWQNGTTKTVDLNIEKIPVSFSMDANGVITMTTEDGTTYTADVGALIKTYTFTDSAVIDFTVTTDASGNKTVTADIVDGSITGQKLQPNYLADCQTAATNSSNSATAAASSKGDSEAWAVGTRGGIPVPSTDPAYNNNSYYWSQHGASNSLAGLTDTDITNPTSGQTIIYDTTDAKWKNGSAVGGGSTIVVTTTETALYGQNVTVTDRTTTLTETFDNTGVATFKGVTMTGNVTIASGTTSTSLNIPYFGNYTAVLSSFSASITVTYPNTASCTCTGNGESYMASGSPYTFTVHGVATYTITTTLDGVTKTDTVIITTDGQTESVTVEYGTINLTYADDFRGQTVNCVNGGTTITKTAPSSGNTMVFYPPTTGTWVISSTVSGSTYTVNAVIASLSTPVSATLNAIPDGGTVTPTDDIQIWLACAGITDKAYTLLSEVLADTDTYTTLLADSNACDYMARSTTWALATGQVPVMTDNTHPSGEVFGTTASSSNGLWKAFDGNGTTFAEASSSSTSRYIGYHFTSAKSVKMFSYKNTYSTTIDTSLTLAYSDDGATYTDVSETFTYTAAQCNTDVLFKLSNDYGSHEYWKLTVATSSARANIAYTIQFYEDVDITTDADAMRLLGMYDYCSNALLGNSTWLNAIGNSTYFESVLNVCVPKMTSNTAPSGEVIYSTQDATNGYYAWEAFDRNESGSGDFWGTTSGAPQYIGYTFPQNVKVCKAFMRISCVTSSTKTYTYVLQRYNNGEWINISDSYTFSTSSSSDKQTHEFIVNMPAVDSSYRMLLESGTTGALAGLVWNVQFYGRHTAQTDIIVSAPSDTIYYMDNGSPVTLCTTDTDGIGSVDWSTLPTGDITLYSSVAKNPTDLTADYSKSIKVTKNKVEGYLMPDKGVLYWWGYKSSNVEEYSTANGWTPQSNRTFIAPTWSTNKVTLSGTATTFCGVFSSNTIPMSTTSVLHTIMKGITAESGAYSVLCMRTTKNLTISPSAYYSIPTSPLQDATLTNATAGNYYLGLQANGTRTSEMYALWYE